MSDYDYTADDRVPYGEPTQEDIDGFMLPDATAPTTTAEQIEESNNFEIPPGEHTLVVTGFRGMPEEQSFTVMLNNRAVSYRSHTVKVQFGLPFNAKKRVEDFFVLPPANPGELDAYYNGKPLKDGKVSDQPGVSASKFYHFISRLGYAYPPGGKLPDAARKLGNWRGRAIRATVEAGGEYKAKDGTMKKGFNRVKFWSYKPADGSQGGNAGGPALSSQRPAAAPAMAGAGAGAAVGAPVGNPVGLDNV